MSGMPVLFHLAEHDSMSGSTEVACQLHRLCHFAAANQNRLRLGRDRIILLQKQSRPRYG